MSIRIFISYRRADSSAFTALLRGTLISYFGSRAVQWDQESIPAGVDYRDHLQKLIARSRVCLVVIGNGWKGAKDSPSRLDEISDPVRHEIEAAFKVNCTVLPVYIDATPHVKADDLPHSLRKLEFLHSSRVSTGPDHYLQVRKLVWEINQITHPNKASFVYHQFLSHLRANNKFLLGAILTALCITSWMKLPTYSGITRALEVQDSACFTNGINREYQIVRGIPDRTSLVAETDFGRTLSTTRHRFDAFFARGAVLITYRDSLRQALTNGVIVRIVLLDHTDANESGIDGQITNAANDRYTKDFLVRSAKQTEEDLFRMQKEINTSHGGNSGQLSIKWLRKPFYNSLWIRDSQDPENALGHIEVSYYGDEKKFPSFRVGRHSLKLIKSLQNQFDYIWLIATNKTDVR